VSRIPTTFSRFASLGLAVAATALAQEPGRNRVERPEGYLVLEGDAGAARSGKGSFSVVPASRHEPNAPADGAEESAADSSGDQYPPPLPPKTPRELCQPQAERFARRLAALRGNPADGGETLDPAVQRAMFGRTALHAAGTEPDQSVPELTWDDELKELHRAFQKCLKAERQRQR
jgi:hypothetical protein